MTPQTSSAQHLCTNYSFMLISNLVIALPVFIQEHTQPEVTSKLSITKGPSCSPSVQLHALLFFPGSGIQGGCWATLDCRKLLAMEEKQKDSKFSPASWIIAHCLPGFSQEEM